MKKRERLIIVGLLACLSLLSALGVWAVTQKADAQQTAAFASRFADCTALGITATQGVTLAVEANALTATWPQTAAPLSVASHPLALATPAHSSLQADVYIGGTQNARGAARFGFRAWLTVTLYRDGAVTQTARVEIPLESDKERARLYSVRVPYGTPAPDHYALGWAVEPIVGVTGAGKLTVAWLEVIP